MQLTSGQSKLIDKLASEELGIPTIVLMENAAINASKSIWNAIQEKIDNSTNSIKIKVGIICGSGNNGGDGFAIARHLYNKGVTVQLYVIKKIEQLSGDALANARICQNMNLPITFIPNEKSIKKIASEWADMNAIIDCLLGVGFHGKLRQPIRMAIELINKLSVKKDDNTNNLKIISIDVPSGLNCNTGLPEQGQRDAIAIEADITITFVAWKAGFNIETAQNYLGKIEVAQIGIPQDLLKKL